MITAGTYGKRRFYDSPEKLDFLLGELFDSAEHFGWDLQAWAVMANHYHFVAHAPDDAETLNNLIMALHSKSAIWINKEDGTPGRRVWFQYRDTCLTYEKSYYARLNYVHHNPMKHGIVGNAKNYRWCSMAWFLQNAETGFCRTVLSFRSDKVKVYDEF